MAQVLEQRWNEKLHELTQVNAELAGLAAAPAAMNEVERDAILALGDDFAAVWNDVACLRVIKKKIARTLM